MALSPLAAFSAPTRAWFEASFAAPTDAQRLGWKAIASGGHTLIHAPTGSGKTLAAFLWSIDHLLAEPLPTRRCRVLYISPLKALAHDVERNLRGPLLGIRHAAERMGLDPLPELTTFLRTGDTPADERRRMPRHPPDVLITTPESLYLILTSQARSVLASVETVIVDEVHAVAATKRGAHLALSLERLNEVAERPPQRIGLSATQRPLETIARFLGGYDLVEGTAQDRPVAIVDVPPKRRLDIEIIVPVEDMTEQDMPDPLAGPDDPVKTKSIWPSVYPRLLELIEANTSTIVFTNSRRLAERLCGELNTLAGKEIARAHHGSVAREQRLQIEESLKRGDLKAVVATSSLELGIDMGAVDLVIQVEAPTSVASGLQRVGRAGHHVGGTSVAKIFPKYRGDLLVATVVASQMLAGDIEATSIPRNPLDVLAQQLVATVALEERSVDDLYHLVLGAAPYRDLSRGVFEATLDMLAGRYPSDLFAELRPRLLWDRTTGMVSARPGAAQLAIANAGTIPDRGLFRVALPDGSRVGELDEEMVYESRVGDVFVLGATAWRISDIGLDRVEVVPAPGESAPKTPFWHGDSLGRSVETGRAVGAFVRHLVAKTPDERRSMLIEEYGLDRLAAANLSAYVEEELEAVGTAPTDRTLVVERFRDEIGDWRLVVLSPFGARVHAPWAMALTQRWKQATGLEVDAIWSDDGMAFRFPDAEEAPDSRSILLDPDEEQTLLIDQLADSSLFAARFREAAARSLLLPRRRPDRRTPLWLQRRRAADLLGVAKQFGDFPIVLETFREVLQDDFDLPGLRSLLSSIAARRIRVVDVEVDRPSPFASSLLFAFVAAFLYEGDTPLAERRASALTLDRRLLSELLGEGELRQLFTLETITAVEDELQHRSRPLHGVEGAADLLRRLGPLTIDEVGERLLDTDARSALDSLQVQRRAIQVRLAGVPRWMAIEDAGRFRDATGAVPPEGVPSAFLEPVDDPLGDVVARYARTHGPFEPSEVADRFGLPIGVVRIALQRLEQAGRIARGAFRPGGDTEEWVDAEVLRRIKRRTLAVLRSEVEAVDPSVLGRFLPEWHQITRRRPRDRGSVVEAIGRLQGYEMPASVFEREILAVRLAGSGPILDQLMLEGGLMWAGRGPLGAHDGKIVVGFRDKFHLLPPFDGERPGLQVHDNLRNHLLNRGASFVPDMYQACGGGDPDLVVAALWDLVWAGEVTNDTLAPLRALIGGGSKRRSGRAVLGSSFPPEAGGRWSLAPASDPDPTVAAAFWAGQLLARHGVVTRAGLGPERLPGGFSAIYPVFQRLEETGRVRRGYFIEGMGGAQFALPGAVDRLRSTGDGAVVRLASTDPANPYGAGVPWPRLEEGRLGRVAGATVILSGGTLVAYHERSRLYTFTDEPDPAVAAALYDVAVDRNRLSVDTIDGRPLGTGAWHRVLLDAGFVASPRGVRARP